MKTYKREAAVAYARKYALSPNPAFYHFDLLGGDCTNFISQCLLAGGAVMQPGKADGWYYNSLNDRSYSWTGVAQLQKFLLSTSTAGPKARIVEFDQLQIGDLIQLRQNKSHFNHTLFVSQITENDIYVCAHSNDVLDRPLSSYNALQLLPLHILWADGN